MEGHIEIVKELIKSGSNINQATIDDGTTPLFIASQEGHIEMKLQIAIFDMSCYL